MDKVTIESFFRDQLFLTTISNLKKQVSYEMKDGDLRFTDKAGNWLHICNLIDDRSKQIGIVSQRVDEERCDGAAYTLADDYGQILYDEVRRTFGI